MDGTSLCKLAYVLVYSSNGGKTKLTNKLVLTQRRTAMPAEFQRLNKLIIFWLRINALHFSLSLPALRLRSSVSGDARYAGNSSCFSVAAFFIPTTLCILLSPILQSSAKRVLSDIPSN
jgi:hypothetical protein